MGNSVDLSYLERPVQPNLLFLTRCKVYVGSPAEACKLYKNFLSMQESGSFYVSKAEFRALSRETPLFGNEEMLFSNFYPVNSAKVNIMEILASIITYSVAIPRAKAKLAFLFFDFDESNTITYDEMTILVVSFIRGIASMTGFKTLHSIDTEKYSQLSFELTNSNKNGNITVEELINWVQNSEKLLNLLQKYGARQQPRTSVRKHKEIRIKKRNIGARFSIDLQKHHSSCESPRRPHKATNSLNSSKISKLITPRISFNNSPKNSDIRADEKYLEKLHAIFFNQIDATGNANVGHIYQMLSKKKSFNKEAEFLFHEFNFDMNAKIKFSQFLNYIEKVNSEDGYFYNNGKEIIHPHNRPRRSSGNAVSVLILKQMFARFDKNHDGFLNYEELREALSENFSSRTIKEIFVGFDLDGNKLIDFNEFVSIFSPNKTNFPLISRGEHRK